METVELGTALQSILKDNANPASLIGLNGNDITKSTMQQIAQVAGGLRFVAASKGERFFAKIYDTDEIDISSQFKIVQVNYGGDIKSSYISVRIADNGNSVTRTNIVGEKIKLYRSDDCHTIYIIVESWERYVIMDIIGGSNALRCEKVEDVDVSRLVEVP